MLIDAWRAVGIEAIAQVDLDEHYNQHKPLAELAPMALTVLATIARRVERDGRLTLDDDAPQAPLERPPMRELLARADATADVDGTGGASGA